MVMNNSGLLKGIRVLDLTRVMSGPFCTSMLADLGAEIIKIEMPGFGDEARHFGPYQEDESTYFMMLNRRKKSVTVNIKEQQGRDIVKALVPQCDVIVENFRPGVMQRLGLGEDAVRALNPTIIYASISGFGQDSPLKNWPAFDLVIQAMGGLMSLTGPKGGPATAVGESMADVCTGMFGAFGIVSALFDRERSGKGHSVDVAMLDSIMAMQLTGLSRQLYAGDTPKPVGNRHPVTYPVDSFATQDGDIVMVCFSQGAFRALCGVMGQPDLADDARFKSNDNRNTNEDALRAIIANWAATQTQDALVETLQNAGIPAGPVWTLQDLTQSDHVAERGLVTEGAHQKFGKVPLVPQPVKFNGAAHVGEAFVPTLGEHTDEVLGELLDLDQTEIGALRANKVI
ncbi:CoA transferase [Parasedimentitalea maritima]|uniref:CoA transferase n=1 Tax=Parasedimentitalea maritima TaxID=2578117 RepID=A0ABY2UU25_9RHOB|nr:CoA transferase [Zongyanglinia marina]TLP62667.1 CoA transferase [Zongyanglinia marina]